MFKKFRSMLWKFPGSGKPSEGMLLEASLNPVKTTDIEKADNKAVPYTKNYVRERRHPRYPIEGKTVHAHMFSSEEAVIRDLSVRGACILTIRDIEVGSRYLLHIQSDYYQPISFECKVTWKRLYEDNETMCRGFLAGLSFIEPTFEEMVRLKEFVRMYGEPVSKTSKKLYAPSALRYSIRDGAKALLNRHEVLNVRKISLGGMLVESSLRLEVDGMYSMKILLSSHMNSIKIKGRIASIVLPSDSPRPGYNLGVEFLDMEQPDKAQLEKFIQNI